MAQFKVEVEYTCKYKTEVNISAKDEGAAEERASELVMSWNNVEDVEILNIEEN